MADLNLVDNSADAPGSAAEHGQVEVTRALMWQIVLGISNLVDVLEQHHERTAIVAVTEASLRQIGWLAEQVNSMVGVDNIPQHRGGAAEWMLGQDVADGLKAVTKGGARG